jgi:hypothetical protein
MKVSEAIRRITFNIGNLDDITGKAINPIIYNRHIVDKLNTQLRQYANRTKGITDVFSFPLETNTPFIEAPPLALRSQSYFYIMVLSQGTTFPADMRGMSDVFPRFRYNPTTGITNWIMPWGAGRKQYFSFFPMNNVSALTTNLTSNITATDTTIPVTSTNGYVNNHGRITIGNEKILYENKDTTNFLGCTRGVETTTAVSHNNNSLVTENNVILFYSRLPEKIIINDDNKIPDSVMNRELEIVEEHMDGIIQLTSYRLLVKLDPTRAAIYKIDGDVLYEQYERDVRRGYYRGRQGTGIRQPFPTHEAGKPYGTNLIY